MMLLKRKMLMLSVNQNGRNVGILTEAIVNSQANVDTPIQKISVTVTETIRNVLAGIVPIAIPKIVNWLQVVEDVSEKTAFIFILVLQRKKKM